MKLIQLFLGALLALASIEVPAQQTVGQVVTEPPKASLGVTRDSYQDSTMQGGVGFGFPGPVIIPPPPPPPPDPCAIDPSASGCGGAPSFCEANPADPTCVTSPPPPPPPTEDPYCSLNPTDPVCGGTPKTFCELNPTDPSCIVDPAMMAGCHVDTDAFNTYENGNCSGIGITSTDEVAFSVGDRLNSSSEFAEFSDASAYAVAWSGACSMPKTVGGSACVVTKGAPTWSEQTLSASATIYRVRDNSVLGSFSITAYKQTCNRMKYLPGTCPAMP